VEFSTTTHNSNHNQINSKVKFMSRMNLVPWLARDIETDPFGDTMLSPFRPMMQTPFAFDKNFMTQDLSDLRRMSRFMKTDVQETDKEITFHCEAVGVPKDNIDVAVKDGILTIKGEKKNLRENADGDWHRTERTFGSFERSFRLPDTVDANADVKAVVENGVLTLRFPKLAETRLKKITID